MTGIVPMRPTAEGRPGCRAMPWALAQPRDRPSTTADPPAADGDEQIAALGHERGSDRRRVATSGFSQSDLRAGGARGFRDQLRRYCPTRRDVDDGEAR